MKVILQQDIATLGAAGDVVAVADGYGRNYLFPRGLAVLADERNMRQINHQKRIIARKQLIILNEAKAKASQIEGMSVTISRKVGEDSKLFGSVNSKDIADALAAVDLQVDRRQITLEEPIRSIGVFTVPIALHREVQAHVKVYVTAS